MKEIFLMNWRSGFFYNGPYYRRTDHNSGYLHPSIIKQYDNHTLSHDGVKKMRMTNSCGYCSLYFIARLHTVISWRFMTSRVISSHSMVKCVVRIGGNWLSYCYTNPPTNPTRSWSKFGNLSQTIDLKMIKSFVSHTTCADRVFTCWIVSPDTGSVYSSRTHIISLRIVLRFCLDDRHWWISNFFDHS